MVTLLRCDGHNVHFETRSIRLKCLGIPVRTSIIVAPVVEIRIEGEERNQRVVRGTAAKNTSTRVKNVRVTTRLLSRSIAIVKITVQQLEPAAQVQHAVFFFVGWPTFNYSHRHTRVFCETVGEYTANRAATHNHIVKFCVFLREQVRRQG